MKQENNNFPISEQLITSYLKKFYGIEVLVLTSLPLVVDMNVSVYRVDMQDKSYFVKLRKGAHDDINIAIMDLLHKSGLKQIILPVQTINGQSIQYIDDLSIIVYPFIVGENGFKQNLTEEQWITLGKALRQVHAIDVPDSIKQRLRQEAYSPKWRNAVKSLYTHIQNNSPYDSVAENMMVFMKEHQEIIYKLVERAEELAKNLINIPVKIVLCHTDIHGGNVLIDQHNEIYIIDWDAPMMAPKERDLMFIGGGVANVWNRPEEEVFFYKGYGKTEIDMTILAYYRYERIVEDIAEFGESLLLSKSGGESRLENYNHFKAMFDPNGVVEIAVETDNRLISK